MSNHNLSITNEFTTTKIKVKVKTKGNGNPGEKELNPGQTEDFPVDDSPDVTITFKMDINNSSEKVSPKDGRPIPPYIIIGGEE